jgi:hypothetical protein
MKNEAKTSRSIQNKRHILLNNNLDRQPLRNGNYTNAFQKHDIAF